MNDILKTNSDIHNRNTRYSKLNLRCPIYKNVTEDGRSFTVRSIKERNSSPRALRESKASLKKDILSKQEVDLMFSKSFDYRYLCVSTH